MLKHEKVGSQRRLCKECRKEVCFGESRVSQVTGWYSLEIMGFADWRLWVGSVAKQNLVGAASCSSWIGEYSLTQMLEAL